jgi:hypothetical protein
MRVRQRTKQRWSRRSLSGLSVIQDSALDGLDGRLRHIDVQDGIFGGKRRSTCVQSPEYFSSWCKMTRLDGLCGWRNLQQPQKRPYSCLTWLHHVGVPQDGKPFRRGFRALDRTLDTHRCLSRWVSAWMTLLIWQDISFHGRNEFDACERFQPMSSIAGRFVWRSNFAQRFSRPVKSEGVCATLDAGAEEHICCSATYSQAIPHPVRASSLYELVTPIPTSQQLRHRFFSLYIRLKNNHVSD